MKIVLDAMGGDYAPQVTVEGAVLAAREYDIEVILVGREEEIIEELTKHDTRGLNLPIVHASEVVEMWERPAEAVRAKKDSSIVVGMGIVERGEAEALVSAGNSGGVMVAALLSLGRIRGVIKRPALAAVYPTLRGFCVLLDAGANADCKPEHLLQFAFMGKCFAEVLGVKNPRIGIVSIGEEEIKGNELVQKAHQLLKKSDLNFVGNVEGKDIPFGLLADGRGLDVVVTDGFTGNVILKLSEGVSKALKTLIEEEIKRNPISKLGGLLAKPAFYRVRKRTDWREYGGASLLGVDGVVVLTHGRSDSIAIKNAIRLAKRLVEGKVVENIKRLFDE